MDMNNGCLGFSLSSSAARSFGDGGVGEGVGCGGDGDGSCSSPAAASPLVAMPLHSDGPVQYSSPDWRHAEAKGPKLEDFMSVGYSSRSSGVNDSCHGADQIKYHDVQAFAGPYFHGHGGHHGVGLEINVNVPPCAGLPEYGQRVLAPPQGHHHFFPPHHGQYLSTGPMAAAPVYNAAAGVDGSMSISGIKSWLRQAMYVPERPSVLSLSVPASGPLPPPAMPPAMHLQARANVRAEDVAVPWRQ